MDKYSRFCVFAGNFYRYHSFFGTNADREADAIEIEAIMGWQPESDGSENEVGILHEQELPRRIGQSAEWPTIARLQAEAQVVKDAKRLERITKDGGIFRQEDET